MAQAQRDDKDLQEEEQQEKERGMKTKEEPSTKTNNNNNNNNNNNSSSSSSSSNSKNEAVSFKFNAQAPEFVPRAHSQIPISGYFYPSFHYVGAGAAPGSTPASDWFYVGDHDPSAGTAFFIANPSVSLPINANSSSSSKNFISEDTRQKIIKQVEYQFTDMSLLANESLSKHVNKDPEGYVPISYIASTKKVKSLSSNHHLIAQALRLSSKLVVSEDNKKVRRKHPFTEKDREELMARTIVAENLPEDHSYQNLEKLFGVIGSVKAIRICHPQESNSSRPKGDFLMSNKLHALVEYETTDTAEEAVEKLNDERNWRKGLRVRLLLRCSPKSVLKTRKSEFDGILDDDDPYDPTEDSIQTTNTESATENNADENSGGSKKGWAKGRGGKGRGRVASHGGRGLLAASPQSSSASQCDGSAKLTFKGPRMPDGTRGFTMGRGKPLTSHIE